MKKNRLALWGLAIVVVMSLLAIAGPWLAPYTYADQDLTAANAWPSAAHWFGTDSLGRDLFVRVLYGARISLSIGLVASLINVLDPDVIVLGGGLSNIDRLYLDLPQALTPYLFSDRCITPMVPARYGDSSGVRGAAWLPSCVEGATTWAI